MYAHCCSTQRQIMDAIDELRSAAQDDTSSARAIEDLVDENAQLRRVIESRELAIASMYKEVFDTGAQEELLVPLGRIVERCDRDLWRRVLDFVGSVMPGRVRVEQERRARESLVATVVDVPPRRRRG